MPVTLSFLKNFVCPFEALSFIQIVWVNVGNSQKRSLVCFFYYSIPTSNAPPVVAIHANMHQEVVAAAIFLGLIDRVGSCSDSLRVTLWTRQQIFLLDVVAVQVYAGVASVICSIVVLGFFVSYAHRSGQW